MNHGSDPPSKKMGHKTPNNKNDVKLLRGLIWLFWYNVRLEKTWGGLKMWQGIILGHSNSNVHLKEGGTTSPRAEIKPQKWMTSLISQQTIKR
jgi:hypothetical protein